MEIASNLQRLKELTTGVRKSRNVAQLQTRECQQGVFKITTVVSSFLNYAKQTRTAEIRELREKAGLILMTFLLKKFPVL